MQGSVMEQRISKAACGCETVLSKRKDCSFFHGSSFSESSVESSSNNIAAALFPLINRPLQCSSVWTLWELSLCRTESRPQKSKWVERIKEAVWWWKRAEKRKQQLKVKLVSSVWLLRCSRRDVTLYLLPCWDPGRGGAAPRRLSSPGLPLHEESDGVALPCAREDHQSQDLPAWCRKWGQQWCKSSNQLQQFCCA